MVGMNASDWATIPLPLSHLSLSLSLSLKYDFNPPAIPSRMNYILLLAIVYIFVPSCLGSSLAPSYAIGYSQSQVTSYHSQLEDITTRSNGMRGWNQRRILDSHLKHNCHRSDDGIEYNPTRFDNFTSDWQGNILNEIGDCNLKQLVLPGTHDSGAYALSSQIVDGVNKSTLESELDCKCFESCSY